MKVLHVLNGFHTAGIEQLALQLVRYAPSEIKLAMLNLNEASQDFRPAFEAVARERALTITDWPLLDGPVLARHTAHLCRRLRPDALMIYPCNRRLLWVALGARLAGVQHLAVHYANPPLTPRQHLQLLVVLGSFTLLGVQAQPCSAALLKASGPLIRALNIGTPIANGVNTFLLRERAEAARRERPADAPFTVLMTARLEAIKDQATLIRAFGRFHRRVPHSRLWLAGAGPLRGELEQLAVAEGLDPASVFLGRRTDVPELLGLADLFAYSTTSAEGAPFALIEAVATGRPIIATATAACPEILAGGLAGRLLPAGDVQIWAEALEQLWSDSCERERLGTAASERAAAFNVHSTAATLYERLGWRPTSARAQPARTFTKRKPL